MNVMTNLMGPAGLPITQGFVDSLAGFEVSQFRDTVIQSPSLDVDAFFDGGPSEQDDTTFTLARDITRFGEVIEANMIPLDADAASYGRTSISQYSGHLDTPEGLPGYDYSGFREYGPKLWGEGTELYSTAHVFKGDDGQYLSLKATPRDVTDVAVGFSGNNTEIYLYLPYRGNTATVNYHFRFMEHSLEVYLNAIDDSIATDTHRFIQSTPTEEPGDGTISFEYTGGVFPDLQRLWQYMKWDAITHGSLTQMIEDYGKDPSKPNQLQATFKGQSYLLTLTPPGSLFPFTIERDGLNAFLAEKRSQVDPSRESDEQKIRDAISELRDNLSELPTLNARSSAIEVLDLISDYYSRLDELGLGTDTDHRIVTSADDLRNKLAVLYEEK